MTRWIFLLLLSPDLSSGAAPELLTQGTARVEVRPSFSSADVDVAIEVANEFERSRLYGLARSQLGAILLGLSEKSSEDIEVRICWLWQREEKTHQAKDCYLDLAFRKENSARDLSAILRYKAALLGDEEGVEAALVEVARRDPDTPAARRSVLAARERVRERSGAREAAIFSRDLALEFEGRLDKFGEASSDYNVALRGLIAECWLEAGRFYSGLRDEKDLRLEFFIRARRVARGTVWWDDATLALARELVGRRALPRALELYGELIEKKESSWFVGSYNSQFLDEAMFEYGAVLERMELWDRARGAYLALVAELPSSRLADDAAYRALQLAPPVKRGEELARFMEVYPHSAYVGDGKGAR